MKKMINKNKSYKKMKEICGINLRNRKGYNVNNNKKNKVKNKKVEWKIVEIKNVQIRRVKNKNSKI